jgi:tetratricopeptide (TPR) repeat protein
VLPHDSQAAKIQQMSSPVLRAKPWIIPLALVVLTIVVYAPVLWSDFVELDDWSYVYQNVHINTGLTPKNIAWCFTHGLGGNWHPLTAMSHMLDCTFFGLNARLHHAENLSFHCANVVLLFFLVRRFGNKDQTTIVAWIIAALFALHPLHVESVAWVAERKDVLSAFFFLLSVHAYFTHVTERNKPAYYRSLLWFGLGLMAKPMLVTLPCVLLLLDFWPLQRTNWKILLWEKWPFFAFTVADCVFTMLAQTTAGALMQPVPWHARPGFVLQGYWFYVEKFFAPSNLCVFYPPDIHPSISVIIALFSVFAAVAVAAVLLRRRQPALFTGWFWFIGMLIPVIGVVHAGSQAYADRYSYLPSIGLSIVLFWPISQLVSIRPRAVLPVVAIATVAMAALITITQTQVGFWQNTEVLYQRAVAVVPNNREAIVHCGGHFEEIGLLDKAIVCYQKALAIDEEGFSLFHLGRIYVRKNNLNAAQKCFERALDFAPDRPEINRWLGRLWDKRNESAKALECFRRAAASNPDYIDALQDFAWLASSDKAISPTNAPKAIEFAQHAVGLEPDNPVNLAILAAAQARAGQFSNAIQTEQQAIKLAEAKKSAFIVERCKKNLAQFQKGEIASE